MTDTNQRSQRTLSVPAKGAIGWGITCGVVSGIYILGATETLASVGRIATEGQLEYMVAQGSGALGTLSLASGSCQAVLQLLTGVYGIGVSLGKWSPKTCQKLCIALIVFGGLDFLLEMIGHLSGVGASSLKGAVNQYLSGQLGSGDGVSLSSSVTQFVGNVLMPLALYFPMGALAKSRAAATVCEA